MRWDSGQVLLDPAKFLNVYCGFEGLAPSHLFVNQAKSPIQLRRTRPRRDPSRTLSSFFSAPESWFRHFLSSFFRRSSMEGERSTIRSCRYCQRQGSGLNLPNAAWIAAARGVPAKAFGRMRRNSFLLPTYSSSRKRAKAVTTSGSYGFPRRSIQGTPSQIGHAEF